MTCEDRFAWGPDPVAKSPIHRYQLFILMEEVWQASSQSSFFQRAFPEIMFERLREIEFWWIGFALLAMWVCVGLILWIIQRDRRRRREAKRGSHDLSNRH